MHARTHARTHIYTKIFCMLKAVHGLKAETVLPKNTHTILQPCWTTAKDSVTQQISHEKGYLACILESEYNLKK